MRRFLTQVTVVAGFVGVITGTAANGATSSAIDLSTYLVPEYWAGDSLNGEADDGGTFENSVTSVSAWSKGKTYTFKLTSPGGTTYATRYVIPGRRLLLGNITNSSIEIRFPKPQPFFKFRAVPGKSQRFAARGAAYSFGVPVGRVKVFGSWTFHGFEELDTPAWHYPTTAVLENSETIRIKDRATGDVTLIQQTGSLWHWSGWGEVRRVFSQTIYFNGAVQQQTGPTTSWFVSGRIQGQAIPSD